MYSQKSMDMTIMANIIICSDGTWNRPEKNRLTEHPTNVLRIARAINPEDQHVFYDWGLGSYHDSVSAGTIGKGIHKNIKDAYRYIVQNFNPDDNLYFFGFSRGAYTVRALTGLINNCGLLKNEHANRIEEAWTIYKDPSRRCKPSGEKAVDFFNSYSHSSKTIEFVGVWDTVGALGIPFSFMGLFDGNDEFYDVKMGSNIKVARHALAIDELRVDFEPTIWENRTSVNLKQVWFAGVHSDIGGSYAPDKKSNDKSSDLPLAWMLREANNAGLKIEPYLIQALTNNPLAKIHQSRTKAFRLRRKFHRPLVIEDKPTAIHISVQQRYLSDSKYRPMKLEAVVSSIGWDNITIEE